MFTDFNALFTKYDHANQKNSTNLNNKKKLPPDNKNQQNTHRENILHIIMCFESFAVNVY
jgi:hypothetical protein